MGWAAEQWLRATKESIYGQYDAEADAADVCWFRMTGATAFAMRAVPITKVIRSADGGNRRRQRAGKRKACAGALASLWYPTQSSFLLNAAMTLAGNDLASYTLDYFDSVQVHRFLGAKVAQLEMPGTAEGDYLPATIQWVAQSKGTATLAKPADAVFPTEGPYEHYESKGLLTVGAVQSKYSALGLKVVNYLAPTWDEDIWISSLYYAGRDVDLSLRIQYLSATLRTAFEAQAPVAVSAGWAREGGLASSFDLHGINLISDLGDELPLDGAAYQTLTFQSYYDQTAGTDCSFTVS